MSELIYLKLINFPCFEPNLKPTGTKKATLEKLIFYTVLGQTRKMILDKADGKTYESQWWEFGTLIVCSANKPLAIRGKWLAKFGNWVNIPKIFGTFSSVNLLGKSNSTVRVCSQVDLLCVLASRISSVVKTGIRTSALIPRQALNPIKCLVIWRYPKINFDLNATSTKKPTFCNG